MAIPRSCGYQLYTNSFCPKCGRPHFNPAKRKVCVRWGVGTRVRILTGEYAGRMADVSGVGREHVFVRIDAGTKKHPQPEVLRMLPSDLRRSSGPMAHFP